MIKIKKAWVLICPECEKYNHFHNMRCDKLFCGGELVDDSYSPKPKHTIQITDENILNEIYNEKR